MHVCVHVCVCVCVCVLYVCCVCVDLSMYIIMWIAYWYTVEPVLAATSLKERPCLHRNQLEIPQMRSLYTNPPV